MTVRELIERLEEFDENFEVYALNAECRYRRVEDVEKDDNYPDVLIKVGDVE